MERTTFELSGKTACCVMEGNLKTYMIRLIKDIDGGLSQLRMIEHNNGMWVKHEDAIREIEKLWDTIEDIQHSRCPQCRRVKGVGESECTYCGWDVRR